MNGCIHMIVGLALLAAPLSASENRPSTLLDVRARPQVATAPTTTWEPTPIRAVTGTGNGYGKRAQPAPQRLTLRVYARPRDLIPDWKWMRAYLDGPERVLERVVNVQYEWVARLGGERRGPGPDTRATRAAVHAGGPRGFGAWLPQPAGTMPGSSSIRATVMLLTHRGYISTSIEVMEPQREAMAATDL